jgi:hypothetical protein
MSSSPGNRRSPTAHPISRERLSPVFPSYNGVELFLGVDGTRAATRKAPAQAELRPTSAGASGLLCPDTSSLPTNASHGSKSPRPDGRLILGFTSHAQRSGKPVRTEPHPTSGASPYQPLVKLFEALQEILVVGRFTNDRIQLINPVVVRGMIKSNSALA